MDSDHSFDRGPISGDGSIYPRDGQLLINRGQGIRAFLGLKQKIDKILERTVQTLPLTKNKIVFFPDKEMSRFFTATRITYIPLIIAFFIHIGEFRGICTVRTQQENFRIKPILLLFKVF